MRRKNGFTLVELVVVTSVITVMVGLLLPAVQQAREAARRTTCRNNLKQIGLALADYENVSRVLPPSCTGDIADGVWYPNATSYHLQSMFTMLLPFLEQKDLEHQVNYNVGALAAQNEPAASQIVAAYRCPSYSGPAYSQSPLYDVVSTQLAIRNYVAMGATSIGNLWHGADGVFYSSSSTRTTDIKDGTSTTIFVAETREPNYAVWIDGTTAAMASHPYNEDAPPDYAFPQLALNYAPYFYSVIAGGNLVDCEYGPSSMHPVGILHLFGDGSVRVITPEINVSVYDALVTIAGGELVEQNQID
jgi:prepilin-type N-terminal cleavage/methylation domain-containing protein